jgi:hypothetical protein
MAESHQIFIRDILLDFGFGFSVAAKEKTFVKYTEEKKRIFRPGLPDFS